MIYFSLPNLYNYSKLVDLIFSISKKQIEKFIEPVQFITTYDDIPYLFLRGSINSNNEKFLKYNELNLVAINSKTVGKRINFSNILVEEQDIEDEYANLILEKFNNGSNYIEISNLSIAEKIKQNFPNYNLIFSENANFIHTFTTDIINMINEQDIFSLITIPPSIALNFDFLKKIKKRKNLEITVNNLCNNCLFKKMKTCYSKEHELIYNFSNYSFIKDCKDLIRYNFINSCNITIKEIKEKYQPLGINHFKLCDLPNNKNAIFDFIFFFVDYFIKQEYKEDILYQLLKEINND